MTPRLGFLGAGWIGRTRMAAIAASGLAEVVGLADLNPAVAAAARADAPGAEACTTLQELLSLELDGLVVATPNALHADQSIEALNHHVAVFCQKPLGRNAAEVRRVVHTAERAGRLLGVDFSYRYTDGLQRIHDLVQSGALGSIYAADLTFHNAYGPDKTWFYDRRLSGGGCLLDLGVHLVDLALWIFDRPVANVSSRLFAGGEPMGRQTDTVEDFATVRLDFCDGATAHLSCSWRLAAGREAVIEAAFYGTRGAARWRNVHGSFYDFIAERLEGTKALVISQPPDNWGARGIVRWTEQLSRDPGFDRDITRAVAVADVLDLAYR
jgi:predicted dehydrogenase